MYIFLSCLHELFCANKFIILFTQLYDKTDLWNVKAFVHHLDGGTQKNTEQLPRELLVCHGHFHVSITLRLRGRNSNKSWTGLTTI